MGNYKFRLSDMMPNAWFYKLKDMNKPRNHHHKNLQSSKKKNTSSLSPSNSSLSSSVVAASNDHQSKITNQPHMSDQRKSYYFTRDLTNSHPNSPTNTIVSEKHFPTEPPRKSSRRRRSTKKSRPPSRLVSTSISAGCSCRATLESVWAKPPDHTPDESADSPLDQTSSSDHDSVIPEYGSDRTLTTDTTFDGMLPWTNSCKCRMENDIVIDIDDHNKTFNHLPPIITTKKQEPTKIQRTSAEFSERNAYGSLSLKVVKEDFISATKTTTSPIRRFSSSPGVKLRTNSPRIANRRIQSGRKSVSANSRRSVSESFAVVKSSKDPRRDFRESMVEMIVENNLKASKDLEELLACYLSLNSDEYHDVIINVFKQIWFDYVHVRLK